MIYEYEDRETLLNELRLLAKSNNTSDYKFFSTVSGSICKELSALQDKCKKFAKNIEGFEVLNNINIKQIGSITVKDSILLFSELCGVSDFYGMLVDLEFLNGLDLKRELGIPSYYNIYNMADLIIRLRDLRNGAGDGIFQEILNKKVRIYIYLYSFEEISSLIPSISSIVDPEELTEISTVYAELIAKETELYFLPKISPTDIGIKHTDIDRIIELAKDLPLYKELYVFTLQIDNTNGLTFAINISTISRQIAYPYYGVAIITSNNNLNAKFKAIYQSMFMHSPNIDSDLEKICLGSLPKEIFINYSALEFGNLDSPLNALVFGRMFPVYIESIKLKAKSLAVELLSQPFQANNNSTN